MLVHDVFLLMCCHMHVLQIQNKKILQHPLVENFLFQKFWGVIFRLLLLQLLFYCTFLVSLNSFALILPRPGPDSEECKILNVCMELLFASTVHKRCSVTSVLLYSGCIVKCIQIED